MYYNICIILGKKGKRKEKARKQHMLVGDAKRADI
jgi:hypothetical protein